MKLSIEEINKIKNKFYKDLDEWETRAAKAEQDFFIQYGFHTWEVDSDLELDATDQSGHIYDLVDFAEDMQRFGYPVNNTEELDDIPVMDVAGWDVDDDED